MGIKYFRSWIDRDGCHYLQYNDFPSVLNILLLQIHIQFRFHLRLRLRTVITRMVTFPARKYIHCPTRLRTRSSPRPRTRI